MRMSSALRCLALALCALGLAAANAAAAPIEGRYIVTVTAGQDPRGIANGIDASTRFVYRSALNGFAARLTAVQLSALRNNPRVQAIEQDQTVVADTTQYMDVDTGDPWGIDRIDQRSLPLSRSFTFVRSGSGVRAYVIDTGIQANHPDFTGRAMSSFDALGGNGADCNGHGTHVAGTIGGRDWGVAKAVMLRGVRVLGCAGTGSYSQVIAGVDWVRAHHIKPAVANMSLGGGDSTALNSAVGSLVSAGVFVAVSAGNSGADACMQSPASAPAAYTVAASTKTDARASYSNWGTCVDGYAPGSAIKSDWIASGSNTISGTSMASPHVSGVAALYKSYGDQSAASVTNWMNAVATAGVITGNPAATPNRLLFKSGL
jgi:subtilisin family serine protease